MDDREDEGSDSTNSPSLRDAPTENYASQPALAATRGIPDVLARTGRFDVRRLLGRGGFGDVYLALDNHLSRLVAIKVARGNELPSGKNGNNFLREARLAASLRHPGIVTVYDVHHDPPDLFIVLEYVDGESLQDLLRRGPISIERAVALMIALAESVGYAHEKGLIHRDLKPANILLDRAGDVRITDFGLAVHESAQQLLAGEVAGTPPYMAPEQVRGETHRLDGRTDLWSLGVVFYLMLTGRAPFRGRTNSGCFEAILESEPKPPRQTRPEIPRELERICLKCLTKRMSERYATARDLADDLFAWRDSRELPSVSAMSIGTASPITIGAHDSVVPAQVIPKGLRAFDRHDADFFLNLVPGPKDRSGLPESVRFWKQRLDETDVGEAFPAGLMYGPSGCGKTSLIRAGILPRLGSHVRPIYIEATVEGTEERLLKAVVAQCPEVPPGSSLVEALAAIREAGAAGAGKVVIVIDQFEQWLHGEPLTEVVPLIRALRQCDGARLQCLILVRDDFAISAARFMHALEVPIVEGHNCAVIDLFDVRHARRVLRQFGEAFGRIADEPDADAFVDRAISLLAEGHRVTPVRLAAFVELVRHDRWDAETIKRFNRSESFGVALLEAYLGEDVRHPIHRQHRQAARRLLTSLLPQEGTELKGNRRSYAEMMQVSGYSAAPQQFAELLQMLDKELRLISPAANDTASPESSLGGEEPSKSGGRSYQLAHDFLVPALRSWLTRRQRETMSGRASLLLEAIASDWNARPNDRRLPTGTEWITIRAMTRPAEWSLAQRKMMSVADRRHAKRLASAALVVAAVVVLSVVARSSLDRRQRDAEMISVASQLLTADLSHVPRILEDLDRRPSSAARTFLQEEATSRSRTADERLRARLFLAPFDPRWRRDLVPRLLEASPEEHALIVDRLELGASGALDPIWGALRDESLHPETRLRAAAAIAELDPSNPGWRELGPAAAAALAHGAALNEIDAWVSRLAPVAPSMLGWLTDRFRARDAGRKERVIIGVALASYLADRVDELADFALDAPADAFSVFIARLRRAGPAAAEAVRDALTRLESRTRAQAGESPARRHAVGLIALLRIGAEQDCWSRLRRGVDPDTRTAFIDLCGPYGVEVGPLVSAVNSETDDLVRQTAMLAIDGALPTASPGARATAASTARALLRTDPAASVHAAAEWLCRRLGVEPVPPDAAREPPLPTGISPGWRVNSEGITLVVIPSGQRFLAGSPVGETDKGDGEDLRPVRIDHAYEISSHEITVEQYKRFVPNFPVPKVVTPSEQCPIGNLSWYDAVKYCRWLSDRERIEEREMCYPPLDQIGPGMKLPEDYLERTGYRLPTEVEWECATRAGTTTSRFFGQSADRLSAYGSYGANSGERLVAVGLFRPNPWGLFDVYGNVLEWCDDRVDRPAPPGTPPGRTAEQRALRGSNYRSTKGENRSASRSGYPPQRQYSFLGMRLARTVRMAENPPSGPIVEHVDEYIK